MAELVDAYDSKSYGAIHGSSILPPGTTKQDYSYMKQKIIVILGPTASGKSDLAVRIAKEINGEIISADSRQVYKDLNIGTGKITHEEMGGIKHYLLDVVDPKERFTVSQFKEMAEECIKTIVGKGKIPIICGGTGFYIDTLINNTNIPEIKADYKLREKLNEWSVEELFQELKKIDPTKALSMNESDNKNKRRLIRAIEIAKNQNNKTEAKKVEMKYGPIFIGLNPKRDILHKRIHDRLINRLSIGMLDEAKKLNKNGLSYERMEELGLEYRYMARHLQGKISYEQMVEELENEIKHYAKRQMTWFKRNKAISWYENANEVESLKV